MDRKNKRGHNYALLPWSRNMVCFLPAARRAVVYLADDGRENSQSGPRIMDFNKDIIDAASLALVIGTLAEWLPPIAAAISIVWTCLRIYGWWKDR